MNHDIEISHIETTSGVAVGRRRARANALERGRTPPSPMNAADIELLRKSLKKVAPITAAVADLFYERLFALLPESKALFPDDLRAQKIKLMNALHLVVRNLHAPETVQLVLGDLGRRHVAYGAMPHHYDAVGAALLQALERGLGDAWNERLERTWAHAYVQVADTMQRAADTPGVEA